MHVVAMPVTDGAPIFEVALGVEVFGPDRAALMDLPWYDLRVCAAEAGRLRLGPCGVLDSPTDWRRSKTPTPSWSHHPETAAPTSPTPC